MFPRLAKFILSGRYGERGAMEGRVGNGGVVTARVCRRVRTVAASIGLPNGVVEAEG